MKRLFFAIALLAACRGENSTTTTDTINTSATETTGTTSTTSTGSSGGNKSSLVTKDKEFFIAAAQGNMSEVAMGRTASEKATNAGVKAFGARMIADHSTALEELKQLALTKGVALPAVVGKDESKVADELSKKVGKDFDQSYMTDMIRDHEKDVKEFEDAASELTDPDLKAWAAKTLPTLRAHLDMAKQVESKLK
jgi:putative membrane protein